ncbi:LytR/AlgR family response regulator transcription factor [Flavilitoribacter nigricans]|uniref:DNA-binding response regulator n=1 Tax=Flavilitoribacter nigricans (strain ATCC 23147 / DSM 23189 / NBRC 102662 / NCIMB 1420 / SS-2) TaxID=1122177 RepID=A0A2D0NDT0_FLAN2|nr:LytTR family DNA-binding domain-containing protein [Flavilitoribacter nigricans]PHN06526.1 DNA-binding response regulator [Flavilitoribacter nigricans DSM 23189 = NBRC 102662]
MKLTAIALDDEMPALEVIDAFAGRLEELDLQQTFTKVGAARRFLEENPIDLVFLDIQMPAMSGIEFSRIIPAEVIVIFTTSYTEYAVESYSLNAVDYLLKPFTFQRFQQALGKAKELYQARLPVVDPLPPLLLKANYGLVKVWPHDILLIEGLDNYLKIHLQDQDMLVVRMTLKEMAGMLPEDQFPRVHRSYIVSLEKVEFVRNKVIQIHGREIPLGGKYESHFFELFGNA